MRLIVLLLSFLLLFPFLSCSDAKVSDPILGSKPTLFSTSITNGDQNVAYGTKTITLTFDQNIVLTNKDAVLLNGQKIAQISAAFKELTFSVELTAGTSYTLQVIGESIKGPTGLFVDAFTISFKTLALPSNTIKTNLVATNASKEAKNVYNFLRENFGKKSISGTMANVSWNTNEAEWINKHTGKYPALNGFDLVHLYASPANWINYNETKVIEDWWNANGLVTIMWHWNVPVSEGNSNYQFYTKDTAFDISKAVVEGTYENTVVKADLEEAASVLLLLKAKNIPILWRPLHEASGKWFWWGAKDAVSCKKLWIMMFDYFESKGLNNLIWVWTTQTNDSDWYPGNQYVDIVGCDLYDKMNVATILSSYKYIQTTYSDKIVTLSEFGSIADFSSQWNSGATWSWIMPWYDYNRTEVVNSANFNETTHQHANIAYWNNMFSSTNVITRDKMPNLK